MCRSLFFDKVAGLDLCEILKQIKLDYVTDRSSHRRCSLRKGILRNVEKLTGKHLCLRPATLLKKRLWCRCFLVNFAKFLRTLFYRTPLGDCFCTEKKVFALNGFLFEKKFVIKANGICRTPLLTHFQPKFHLCRNQVVHFYQQNV